MSNWITSSLSALDYNIADKIKREFRIKEAAYKKIIRRLEADKSSYLNQIETNESRHAADMVELKGLLSEVRDEVQELRGEMKLKDEAFAAQSRELEIKRAQEIDLSGMLEAFMEAYPEMSLLDISKKRNPETIP